MEEPLTTSKRTIRLVVAIGVATLSLGAAGGAASAAHCTGNGGPGNSDFAAHVRGAQGPGGHIEGDHRGWSTCEGNSANDAG